MRNKNWLRYGIASASIAGLVLGGVLVACGDDDNGSTSGKDAGADTNVPPTDGSTPDTGTDAAKPDAGQPAKLILVHAASDLGENNQSDAVRVCFATAPKSDPQNFQVTPFPILPHSIPDGGAFPIPGIFPGTGGPFPSSGADYEDLVIRPYVMNAERLAERGVVGNAPSVPRCNQVLKDGFVPDAGWDGGEPLQANKDFWQLPDIPAGTLKKNGTYMLVVTGCTQDAPVGTLTCGTGNDGNPFVPTGAGNQGLGNLKLLILELDTATAVAADELGAQVVHASPAYQAGRGATVLPPFTPYLANVDAGADGGHFPLTPDGGELSYNRDASAPTALAKVKGLVTANGFFAANEDFPPGSGDFIRIPLNNTGIPDSPSSGVSIQALTTGDTGTTALYVNGKKYTFVLVGDPNGTANKKIHYLGFPNDFTPPPLQ